MPAHDYVVCVRRLRVDEGGGFVATIPQLGLGTFVADGETPTEALQALDTLYAELRPQLEKEGYRFPEPRDEGCLARGLRLVEMTEWLEGGGCLPYPTRLKPGFQPMRPRQADRWEPEPGVPEKQNE